MSDFFDRFSKVPLSQKVLLLLLVMAALFIGFYMFMYNDLEQEILAKREEQQQLSTDQARLQGLQGRVVDLEREVDEEMRRREGFSVDLPVSDDIPTLIDEIEETVQDIATSPRGTKLEITEVRRRPYAQGSDFTRIPLDLRLSGTFDQLIDLTWALARMSRIVHVRTVNMTLEGNRNVAGSPVLRIDLGLEAFFRPEG